ncbi:hypothetical protein MsAg5_14220 [Methanosarcinaceae archaeon Ag5]|uniref:Apea-like HEPN domain-containing protein n=2 Tax=Methanolapillus africanus TaxID=3028297 RepID=A0AAE4MJA8_9EURY|nr:hypothetical protein [Methanosarcinaceae archaeon Ag5]
MSKNEKIKSPSEDFLKNVCSKIYRKKLEIINGNELINISYDEVLDPKNNLCYFWIESKKGPINKDARILSQAHKAITSNSHRKNYYIVKTKDESSEYYCKRLFPLFGTFENSLRELAYLVVIRTYGSNWPEQTRFKVKTSNKIEYGLQASTITELYKFLFDKEETNKELWDYLSDSNMQTMSKEEIISSLNKFRPHSLWDRLFINDFSSFDSMMLEDVREGRNQVAHNHTIDYNEFNRYKKELKELIGINKKNIEVVKNKNFTTLEGLLIRAHWALMEEGYGNIPIIELDNASISFEFSIREIKLFLVKNYELINELLSIVFSEIEPFIPKEFEELSKEKLISSISSLLTHIYKKIPQAFEIFSPLIFTALTPLLKSIPSYYRENAENVQKTEKFIKTISSLSVLYSKEEMEAIISENIKQILEADEEYLVNTSFSRTDFAIISIRTLLVTFNKLIFINSETESKNSNNLLLS